MVGLAEESAKTVLIKHIQWCLNQFGVHELCSTLSFVLTLDLILKLIDVMHPVDVEFG